MRKHLLAALLSQALAMSGMAAADEQGWFLEPSSGSASFLSGADVLLPRLDLTGQHVLSLNAGYRFSESFTVQAMLREMIIDSAPMQQCQPANFACMAASPPSPDGATGYTLSLMPALTLYDDLAVYGHLGIQGWNVEANGNPDLRKSELLFGVGIGYDVSNPLRLQLEYRSLDLDIKLTSVGFSWRF